MVLSLSFLPVCPNVQLFLDQQQKKKLIGKILRLQFARYNMQLIYWCIELGFLAAKVTLATHETDVLCEFHIKATIKYMFMIFGLYDPSVVIAAEKVMF